MEITRQAPTVIGALKMIFTKHSLRVVGKTDPIPFRICVTKCAYEAGINVL